MAEAFLRLSGQDRLDALGVAADRLGRPAHLLEKDVWVVWAIQKLFSLSHGRSVYLSWLNVAGVWTCIHISCWRMAFGLFWMRN